MFESYESSMERKRAYYPMRMGRYAYDILNEKIGNKEDLTELTLIGPRIHLAKVIGCSFELFKKLCDEYDVKTLPHSYWKRAENLFWNLYFDKKIAEFKIKYLGELP